MAGQMISSFPSRGRPPARGHVHRSRKLLREEYNEVENAATRREAMRNPA